MTRRPFAGKRSFSLTLVNEITLPLVKNNRFLPRESVMEEGGVEALGRLETKLRDPDIDWNNAGGRAAWQAFSRKFEKWLLAIDS